MIAIDLTERDRDTLAEALFETYGDDGTWTSLSDAHKSLWRSTAKVALSAAVEALVSRVLSEERKRIAQTLTDEAVKRFNQFGPRDPRGAALWDASAWVAERGAR